MTRLPYHGLIATLLVASHAAAALDILSSGAEGSFTFSLTGPANYSVQTEDFSTGIYYVPPINQSRPVAEYAPSALSHLVEAEAYIPFTVFVTNASVVTGGVLRELVAGYSEDDVFTSDFLEGIEIITTADNATWDQSATDYLETLGPMLLLLPSTVTPKNLNDSSSSSFTTVTVRPRVGVTPPGPYLATLTPSGALTLRKVYGMFSDYQESFLSGVTENDDGSYSSVMFWNTVQYAPLIPFPSKLYSSLMDPERYPLAGMRFSLKDLMPVRGIVLTGGSRAYAKLYDAPANETAPAIKRLLDLGAVLVGMAKLSTFAYGSWPYQNMDYSYSWNIRADGWLGLSASSFGSAAGIAAYDQLDFSVGSDTTGSVRNPADRVGVYGIRPSWGAIDLTKVIPSATSMDTLGVLARSPMILTKVLGAWEAVEDGPLEKGNFTFPKKIIFPSEFFPVNNSVAQDVIDTWLANMTAALGMEIEQQNVTTLFHETINQNDTLATYTSDFGSLTRYDNWNLFGEQFVADYRERFDNRTPAADNQVLIAWRQARTYPDYRKNWNEDRMATFGNFVNEKVIPYNNETCTEGFWMYHISDTGGGVPEYRDVLNYDYFPPFRPMRAASIAPYAKLVDVTVPIGTITYDSLISLREEELVITLNFVAHRGCDAVLFQFLNACEAKGFCKPVKTGITAW
ncbi:hypothetical protein A1O7_09740 [Cladophialophora yegresii CBS 114405]|uniref:Uncharacterized protein n=1 Tax=Cladophialophora yegresii CBS 114405 TaxID=1182544 RepID=W9VQK0_9EURO|nr:uncharacterized protein A1O7_09740 [Cladophialophora yegresii CBS 114405]EXJ54401.1 hypothetical protein A1O7_09740 [Cladophialophora yegresii CBS 114405]